VCARVTGPCRNIRRFRPRGLLTRRPLRKLPLPPTEALDNVVASLFSVRTLRMRGPAADVSRPEEGSDGGWRWSRAVSWVRLEVGFRPIADLTRLAKSRPVLAVSGQATFGEIRIASRHWMHRGSKHAEARAFSRFALSLRAIRRRRPAKYVLEQRIKFFSESRRLCSTGDVGHYEGYLLSTGPRPGLREVVKPPHTVSVRATGAGGARL
jgi:hypothetical protein